MVKGGPALKDELRRRAQALGFSGIGFARADALDNESSRLQKWLSDGRNGEMEWLERDARRRANPASVLDGVATVICLAVNYYHKLPLPGTADRGRVALYACGHDYHTVISGMLKKLEAELRQMCPDAETKSFVDSGPVMEKAWAARAGIGWQGKNTIVITKEFGSWVYLSVLLTTARIEPDQRIEDECGSCTCCLDACPTGALTHPYSLDARRCISYLTIERSGDAAPHEDFEDYQGWIFGCDICQEVCPCNSTPVTSALESFTPREGVHSPDLRSTASITEAEFETLFGSSAAKRSGAAALRRNARIVLRQREAHIG